MIRKRKHFKKSFIWMKKQVSIALTLTLLISVFAAQLPAFAFEETPLRHLTDGVPFGETPQRNHTDGMPFGETPLRHLTDGVPFGETPQRNLTDGVPFGEMPQRSLTGGVPFVETPQRSLTDGGSLVETPQRRLADSVPFGETPRRSRTVGVPFGETPQRNLTDSVPFEENDALPVDAGVTASTKLVPMANYVIDLSSIVTTIAGVAGVTYAGVPGKLTFGAGANGHSYTIVQSAALPEVTVDIIFENGVTPGGVTLNGVNIAGNIVLNGAADVALLLSNASGKANIVNGSILVQDDGADMASLTIDSATAHGSSNGSLTVINTNPDNAAIGGGYGKSAGVVTINGGAITAIGYKITDPGGSSYGAGIGGGNGGAGGTITINGGAVNAIGNNSFGGGSRYDCNSYGAGIGGGAGGAGGTITITGGTVDARGGSIYGGVLGDVAYDRNVNHSAGIGGGRGGAGGTISILGGDVKAYGLYGWGLCYGAGIGGGDGGDSGNITIEGGTVTAYGCRYPTSSEGSTVVTSSIDGFGAGIGGGRGGRGETITINNGNVTAYCNIGPGNYRVQSHGAGIGGGGGDDGGAGGRDGGIITINGGQVSASGSYGAGIGGGGGGSGGISSDGGDGGTITINGALRVDAFSGSNSAAIGGGGCFSVGGVGGSGGAGGSGGTIKISNSTVSAMVASGNGAAIGGGGGSYSDIGGSSSSGAGGDGGTITITDKASVYANGKSGAGIGGGGGGGDNGGDGNGGGAVINIDKTADVIANALGSSLPAIHAVNDNAGDAYYVNVIFDYLPEVTSVNLPVYQNGDTTSSRVRLLTLLQVYRAVAFTIPALSGDTAKYDSSDRVTYNMGAYNAEAGFYAKVTRVKDNDSGIYSINKLNGYDAHNPDTGKGWLPVKTEGISLSVIYDANWPDGAPGTGSAPEDSRGYAINDKPDVLANPGNLAKEGYAFLGWGITAASAIPLYRVNGNTVTPPKLSDMGIADVTLYAVWRKNDPDNNATGNQSSGGGGGGGGGGATTTKVPNPVQVKLTATVIVDGDMLTAGQFKFELLSDARRVLTAANDEEGHVVFEVTVPAAGTYVYTVREIPNAASDGWVYDVTEHTVTITVTANDNVLSASVDKTPTFTNIFTDVETPLNLFISDHIAYIQGYPEGDARPEQDITRAEAAAVFFRVLTDELRDEVNRIIDNTFPDVQIGDWFYDAVSAMSKMGIVQGYQDGTFGPDNSITRAELATIAARFARQMNELQAGDRDFSDIAGHWAEDDIRYTAAIGWVNGYSDGTFGPDQPITRAEFMTLVNRILKRVPETEDDLLNDDMVKWADNSDPTAWYYLAVQEATNSHIPEYKTGRFVPGLLFEYEHWVEMMMDNRD